ncbi:MAG: hypothetical protein QG673_1496 [Pseudomonadota bacterium]|nr:hypothetical protein [Pseudomonadota bacterium]
MHTLDTRPKCDGYLCCELKMEANITINLHLLSCNLRFLKCFKLNYF